MHMLEMKTVKFGSSHSQRPDLGATSSGASGGGAALGEMDVKLAKGFRLHRNRAAGVNRRARALTSLCDIEGHHMLNHCARRARHAVPLQSRYRVFTQNLTGALSSRGRKKLLLVTTAFNAG